MKTLGNTKNPNILVIGCFHGDEPQGRFLIEKYLNINANTNLLFVPCLNEYGFEKPDAKCHTMLDDIVGAIAASASTRIAQVLNEELANEDPSFEKISIFDIEE